MKFNRKIFIGILIFMTIIIIGRAYADFGGFSGGGGSSSHSSGSSGGRLRSRMHHGRSSFLEDFKVALMPASLGVLYILYVLKDGIKNSISRKRRLSKIKPIEEYHGVDLTFNEEKIKTFIRDLYPKLQEAWQYKSINSLSEYMTEDFFESMNRRLDDYRKNNRTDHTEGIEFQNIEFKGWSETGGNDYLFLEFETKIISYIVDDLTGEIKSGDKNQHISMRYEIDLVRKAGNFSEGWKICDMSGYKV